MSCQDLVCKETEYQARNAKVINSVPFPDTQACRKNQASAETQAKTRVDSDVSKRKKSAPARPTLIANAMISLRGLLRLRLGGS